MRIVVVVENVPNQTAGGGALTAWSLLHRLQALGHEVHPILLRPPAPDPQEARQLQALTTAGFSFTALRLPIPAPSSSWRRRLLPNLDAVYPALTLSPSLAEIIHRLRPDELITYHWNATAACAPITGLPKVALLGDPDSIVRWYRHRWEAGVQPRDPLRRLVHELEAWHRARWDPQLMQLLLQSYTSVAFFAAHHAQWARRHGIPATYLRTPIPDPQPAPRVFAHRANPNLLLLGHHDGIATKTGLAWFTSQVLPALDRQTRPYTIHVVGRRAPLPAAIHRALERPNVMWHGHLSPVDTAFTSADALVVPTPIPLGIRIRILTAWSFGCPVITHAANTQGIPELQHGVNALVSQRGEDMAEHLKCLWETPALQAQLSTQGRKTYEQYFSPTAFDVPVVIR